MRKEFTLPPGKLTRARAFFAMPGYGSLSINGRAVDGVAGTRTWSQYDKRTIYGVYDVKEHLMAGAANAVGGYIGKGWYGHWGYGAVAMRLVLSVTVDGKTTTLGSDSSWTMAAGPVLADDEYNGENYDARLETPGASLIRATRP
jgi:alpha-L-rhamnosidase